MWMDPPMIPVRRCRPFLTYPGEMIVALMQILSGEDPKDNLRLVEEQAERAAGEGAELLIFPEATSQAFGTGRLDERAEALDGAFASGVRAIAERLDVVIVVGMFCTADTVERDGKQINRVDNVALVAGRGIDESYAKIHCYDAFGYRESDTVRPGNRLVAVDVPSRSGRLWKFGLAICFDIRFPEQFIALARDYGVEAIAVPTSWHDGPGKLEQWRILTSARALDSTCYILAAGQARPGGAARAGSDDGPTGIGHSQAIAPNGERLAEGGYGEEIVYVELDSASVESARSSIPVLLNEASWLDG